MNNNIRLILAPIRGITGRIWRNAFARHFGGFDTALDPFIACTQRGRKNKGSDGLEKRGDTNSENSAPGIEGDENNARPAFEKLLASFDPALEAIPTVPQILSNNAEDFVPLANALYAKGYSSVNWNIGCPHPLVISKKKGSYLLAYPVLIEKFLEAVLPELKGSLSIKLRLGYERSDEILSLLPVFDRFDLASLTVHARTGIQQYAGECDLDAFERCIGKTRHRLVYNGDITTPERFETVAARFGSVTDFMIGRGALADPFLPMAIAAKTMPTAEKRRAALKAFHDELFEGYSTLLKSPAHVLDKMKGFWEYYSRSFDGSAKVFKRIRKTKSPAHYHDEVERVFEGR